MARFTVRQALDELVKEGLIIKHKGKGSIVSEKQRKALGIFSIRGFSAVVGEAGKVDTVFLKKPYQFKWGADFFYPLTAAEKADGASRSNGLLYSLIFSILFSTSKNPG